MNRYIIEEGSNSGHCCFSYTVVDTTRPEIWNGEIVMNDNTGQPTFTPICECFEKEEAEKVCEALNNSAVAQSWELNEETAKFLADLILANDEPTPVTLSVGFIKDDDGKIQHGLRVHESEYPEEGAELLVESTPSPQKAPPVEVVRNAILGVQCAAELLEALPSLIETNVEVHAQIHETYEFLKGVLQTAKEHGL